VEVDQWRCPNKCADPDGKGVFTFADAALLASNDHKAEEAWRKTFGEPMPPSGRRGRPSDDPRTERVQIRLSESDVELLDEVRGEESRSEFLRKAIKLATGGSG
jgi:hypothetical protein